jgi:hypothetical protein
VVESRSGCDRRVGVHRIEGSGGKVVFSRGRGFEMRGGGRSRCWHLRRGYWCGGGSGRLGRRGRLGRLRMLSRDIVNFCRDLRWKKILR